MRYRSSQHASQYVCHAGLGRWIDADHVRSQRRGHGQSGTAGFHPPGVGFASEHRCVLVQLPGSGLDGGPKTGVVGHQRRRITNLAISLHQPHGQKGLEL